MAILAVDPGISGAMAVLSDGGDIMEIYDLPTMEVKHKKTKRKELNLALIVSRLRHWDEFHCIRTIVIENVHAYPKQGITSIFRFGQAFGQVHGMLTAVFPAVSVNLVAPGVWKAKLKLTNDKDLSRTLATRIWPKHAPFFARKTDADRAEACLIGIWWLKQEQGK